MSYSTDHLRTAGKITVYTSLIGVLIFAVVFIFNLGTAEIKQADAQSQTATTSVTVVNTAPYFTVDAYEDPGSATTSPTNVGDQVTWRAIAEDSNGADYYLLVCSTNATPTPNSGVGSAGAPDCDPGGIRWAVAWASSSAEITAATTTTAVGPFATGDGESFPWFAWVCDGDSVDPKCSATSTQGLYGAGATSSSPFEVNHRPSFTIFTDTSPADPGATVFFYSTSSDADTSGSQDRVQLFVCNTNSFDSVNDTCSDTTLASTTAFVAADASSTYSIPVPLRDTTYGAYGFVIDEHGFEAQGGAQGTDSVLTVNNVAPTISSTTIFINDGNTITLSNAATETPGFTLRFTADDNNTCENAASTTEVTSFALSLYRKGSDNSSTTCSSAVGDYDPNDCYPSGATSTGAWNLICTASSTSCTGAPTDTDIIYDCTFPLWYIADPTVPGSFYATNTWSAQVQGIDDDGAAGAFTEADVSREVELDMLQAFALNTPSIPYGSLEPGDTTDPLIATTTVAATGNVGLDKTASGTSMCTTYTGLTPCPVSATSTIPANEQRFATSKVAFAAATQLSSAIGQEIEINVPKSTSTSTPTTTNAYWGISVPGTISFAGDYTGQNVFFAVTGEVAEWKP